MNSAAKTRIDLLTALAELSRIHPDWRLGQTMANLAMTAGRMDAGGVWDLEDDEALAAVKSMIERHSEVEPETAEPATAPHHRSLPGV